MTSEVKCSFMSLREDFDTTTAAGEMLFFKVISFARFERKQTCERASANILARASRGLYKRGTIPLGFKMCHTKMEALIVMSLIQPLLKPLWKRFSEKEVYQRSLVG